MDKTMLLWDAVTWKAPCWLFHKLTLRLLGVGRQVANLQAGRISHLQGWPWGYEAPPQLLQALHLQWGELYTCCKLYTCSEVLLRHLVISNAHSSLKTRWSVSIWAWPGVLTTTLVWSMRPCSLVDLKPGRRLPWGVWLGEGGMRTAKPFFI